MDIFTWLSHQYFQYNMIKPKIISSQFLLFFPVNGTNIHAIIQSDSKMPTLIPPLLTSLPNYQVLSTLFSLMNLSTILYPHWHNRTLVLIICHWDYHMESSNRSLSSIPLPHLSPFLLQLEYSFADINLIWYFYFQKVLCVENALQIPPATRTVMDQVS